ncbi:MAG TPA: HNH endonuclease [Cyclobacteriaceae bacterium]|nr:HNH endonuclease [Cyclobacteriaceae bacterium]
MLLDFSQILIGQSYSRETLAKIWGFKGPEAITRGVFTPQGANQIILFVTKEKPDSMTQYVNGINQDMLFWEGEKGHGNDTRIASRNSSIHVFFRDKYRSEFRYEGIAELRQYKLRKEEPSKFVFRLIDREVSENQLVNEIKVAYDLSETEKEAIIRSRIGQGVYRKGLLQLWGSCSVTGFTKPNLLVASHIKPWKLSSNEERLSIDNGLLLIPTLDKLFDLGYISFEKSGKIMMSNHILSRDWERIGINSSLRLREVPQGIQKYLEYHTEYRFDLVD